MNNKINLEEIIIKHIPTDMYNPDLDKYYFSAMKDACMQILELAAENVKMEHVHYGEYTNGRYITNEGFIEFPEFGDSDGHEIFINKQSILDTINNVE